MTNLSNQNCTSTRNLRGGSSPLATRSSTPARCLPPAASRRLRPAFTLVELLVVIAIIGILIALLLPAVQAAREAARSSQCVDNLKNLGLGCINYASAKKTLPPGKVVGVTAGTPCGVATAPAPDNGKAWYSNWALEILPFMEETALYQRYHFELSNLNSSNDPVRQTLLSVQSCPSDPNPPSLQTGQVSDENGHIIMTSSYKGVAGRGFFVAANPAEAYWDSPQGGKGGETMRLLDRGPLPVVVVAPPGAGQKPAYGSPPTCTMGQLSKFPVKVSLITDGTSKTLLIGEYHYGYTADDYASHSHPLCRLGQQRVWNGFGRCHVASRYDGHGSLSRKPADL